MNDHSAPGAAWNNLPRGSNAAASGVAGAPPERLGKRPVGLLAAASAEGRAPL
ncbi:hypothetical protein WME73_12780 [Sorangium sp. So ce302]|uniref:hypothetical protein n=1 Tax=unclassified Sorangium TaxID=2621164 RepID=UPI003F5D9EA5